VASQHPRQPLLGVVQPTRLSERSGNLRLLQAAAGQNSEHRVGHQLGHWALDQRWQLVDPAAQPHFPFGSFSGILMHRGFLSDSTTYR